MKTFEERLEAETSAWVQDGLISTEQRARLLTRHPNSSRGASRFLGIVATIGGALFVVGVSLIIKANWNQIGDWLKIGGLVVLMLGAYAGGWRLKFAPGSYPKTGEACFMTGAVFFLLGIALVSQIYHLNSRAANGVLVWWAGIVALPWLVRAKGMQFVSVVAWFAWLTLELMSNDSPIRLLATRGEWYDREFLLYGAASFLLGATLLALGAGLRGGRYAEFAGLHEKLGLIVITWSLYVLGFSWSAHGWYNQAMRPARMEAIVFLALMTTVALGWAGWRNAQDVKRLGWLLGLAVVPVGATLFGIELHDSNWLWGGFACVALFVLNLGMIRVGLIGGRESWINLGIAGIALNIVTRYFLLFGTMLEGGVFFIVTGLLVLGLGYYLERKRRQLVGAIRKEAVS